MRPEIHDLLDLAIPSLQDYALVLLDPQGVIVGWLAGAETILGYREEEIVGCDGSVLFVPEDIKKGVPAYELEVARRSPYAQDDRWHVRGDATRVWISGTAVAIRDHAGELRGYFKIMRDRTDLRMNVELRANQVQALEDAMKRMQQFIETVGHELRNPLAPIKNVAAILPRLSEDPAIHKLATTLSHQLATLERMVGDLMDVSRLQNQKLDLRLRAVDIRELLEEQLAGQAPVAEAKGVRLEGLFLDHPLPLMADADRLRQAIANLLGNAIKYTPEGGTVWLKVTQEGGDIIIKVQDTGIGIAPDVLPQIFDLFTQEPRARALAPGGLGVGLAIVRQIAELHGGVAQARSGGTDKGSEFALRLPCKGPATGEISS